MSRYFLRAVSISVGFCSVVFAGGLPTADAAPPSQASLRAAEHARIVGHWTPERRAAAIPRDFVIDDQGKAYLKLPGGALQPYGRSVAEAGRPVPAAKPGGGGGGSSDNEAPVIDAASMNPGNGATIGSSYTFSAVVTDNVALRSVSFKVRKGTSRAQSFSASLSSGDTWTVSLSGFSDGSWSWWVEAKDTANLTSASPTVSFAVDTGGGGTNPGTGDTVTNAHWTADSVIKRAEGRIYFEMPSNSRWNRWAGYVCSGTVMQDSTTGRSVIITAAHCVYDDANGAFARNVMFIPNQDDTTGAGTDLNCSNDPIGCWTPSFGVVDVNWTTRTFPDNVAWDYAYYVVGDSGAYTPGITTTTPVLDTAAGAMPVNFGAAASNDGVDGMDTPDFTWALGYSYSDDPNFMYCAEDMSAAQEPEDWWLPSCELSGGSSGGAWLQKGPGSSGDGSDVGDSGRIMSVNSWGYTTGPGMAGPKLDRAQSSAECVFLRAKGLGFALEDEPEGRQGAAVTCP